MKQKIENNIKVVVGGVSLSGASGAQFYLAQGSQFFSYVPTIVDDHTITVKIPYADAMLLEVGSAEGQLAFKDAYSNPHASDILTLNVERLLKEGGYNE